MTLTRPGSRAVGLVVLLLALLWLAVAAPAFAQGGPRFPALSGRVVDGANLISPAQEQALTTKLEALQTDTTDQLVVVTVPDLQGYEIEEYGYQLGRAWGIGQDKTNNGVLLIVAPNERKVRIEVGYGLEGILTDALSAVIIQNEVLPPFRDGDYARGIEQGVTAIDAQLRLDPAEAQARAAAAGRAQTQSKPGRFPLVLIPILFIFVLSILASLASRGRGGGGALGTAVIWAASEALRNSGRGGGSSWGGGGGGFGGGGGSFGGGGASGGW